MFLLAQALIAEPVPWAHHAIYAFFFFVFGASVGSFLNVVVWRLPRGESLLTPPSHCPRCGRRLKWYDNLPVLGWIKLRGRCRFCNEPISSRYPIVEAVTGGLFAFYYLMFFAAGYGPCVDPGGDGGGRMSYVAARALTLADDWPVYALYMLLISVLLAASLIDVEHFIIPIEMIWFVLAPIGMAWHTIIDMPMTPGALNASPIGGALAAGGGIGLLVSIALWYYGKIPASFADGGPLMEVEREANEREAEEARRQGKDVPAEFEKEYTPAEIRKEIRKEITFLLPPLGGAVLMALLVSFVAPAGESWRRLLSYNPVSAFLGSLLGLLIGGFVVWLTRILGTLGFGREAMGMGDVHLMAGVGAVIGAGASTVAFFLAPFFGMVLAVYLLLTGKRRELPYGPYLSLATAFVLLSYCPIAAWLAPGLAGLRFFIGQLFGADFGA